MTQLLQSTVASSIIAKPKQMFFVIHSASLFKDYSFCQIRLGQALIDCNGNVLTTTDMSCHCHMAPISLSLC